MKCGVRVIVSEGKGSRWMCGVRVTVSDMRRYEMHVWCEGDSQWG